nr:recombinase zinc beta ribbon domain-containing protein [Dechloromonas sp.]
MAQNVISQRSPDIIGGRARSNAVFSGILHCGQCGHPMMTESATGRNGARYHYYNCRAFLKGAGCSSRRLAVAPMDEYLLEAISTRIFTPENIANIVFDIKQQAGQWSRERQMGIDNLAAELNGVEKRLRRLYETIEAGAGLSLNDIAPRLRELRAQQDHLKMEIERLDAECGPVQTLSTREIEGAAKIFRDILVTAESPKKVREFLGNVISKITVGESDVRLEYIPSRLATAKIGGSHCEVRWLPDLGSNQGPTD